MIQVLQFCVRRAANCAATLLLLVAFGSAAAGETTLHEFMAGSDGAFPGGGVIGDRAGYLYGTTISGGNGGCGFGCGVVFKLGPDGTETILHDFEGTDGWGPGGSLLADSRGDLYGTTYVGGGQGDGGVLYELAPDGSYTVLYRFCSRTGCRDGADPLGALIADNSGNLYGTTSYGGADGSGTVFKLTKKGRETVLYSFCSQGCADGYSPSAGLVADASGNLYGTTETGGANGYGVAFKVAPDGTETVLHSFCNSNDSCSDGSLPDSALIIDGNGNLYGSTLFGGGGDPGCGVVYKIAPDGTESIVHDFQGGADGCQPAGLILDGQGNILGVSASGGNGPKCSSFGPTGCGTVFKITPDGTETVLFAFPSPRRGYQPMASLFEDRKGTLYGTTSFGGERPPCRKFGYGCGVVFKLRQ